MKASLLTGVRTLELRDVPDPEPGPRDVLVRPASVGLCGTDFHVFDGEMNFHAGPDGRAIPLEEAPQILGHEITGTVVEVGRDVRDLFPGDRVVVDQGVNCNSAGRPLCEYCATGDSHQCAEYAEHGLTGLPGGFAEALATPALGAVRIDGDLAFERAALTEPLACVLHSADATLRATARYGVNHADPTRRVRSAIVTGAGPAGLLWIQVLRRVLGFEGRLFCAELDARKRALAEEMGAEPIDPSACDLAEAVRDATDGRRCELLVEATGNGPIFAVLPSLIRKQATFVLYGVGHGGASLELLNQVQWKEPSLVASVGASGGFDEDGRPEIYRRALRLLERGAIDVTRMVTHRYDGLEALPSAFAGDHTRTGYVKGVVNVA